MVLKALRAIALAGLATAAALGGSVARELRASDTQAHDYPTVQALNHFASLIEHRTGGRYTIKVFHSNQLGEEKETMEQTRLGAIDINRINVAPLADLSPEALVLSLPFLFRSPEHLNRVLEGPIGQEVLDSLSQHGLVGLAYYDSGARSIYNNTRPVRRPEDLKGLRIRIQQSRLMTEMLKSLGAVPVPMPYGQVRTALEAGILEGAENNWPSYITTGHYRSAPFYALTEHTMSPEILLMSKQLWDRLSPEDRVVFRQAAKESAEAMRERWRLWEERSRVVAAEAGVTVVADLDRKAFADAVRPVYQLLAGGERAAALIRRIDETP